MADDYSEQQERLRQKLIRLHLKEIVRTFRAARDSVADPVAVVAQSTDPLGARVIEGRVLRPAASHVLVVDRDELFKLVFHELEDDDDFFERVLSNPHPHNIPIACLAYTGITYQWCKPEDLPEA